MNFQIHDDSLIDVGDGFVTVYVSRAAFVELIKHNFRSINRINVDFPHWKVGIKMPPNINDIAEVYGMAMMGQPCYARVFIAGTAFALHDGFAPEVKQ